MGHGADFRDEIVVRGRWTEQASAAVWQEGVSRLVLNYALGFDEPSLDFLRDLPIRELTILDWRVADFQEALPRH